jgi:hypothetical protein
VFLANQLNHFVNKFCLLVLKNYNYIDNLLKNLILPYAFEAIFITSSKNQNEKLSNFYMTCG